MRALFLSNLYPPHELGGLEQLCQEVADGLKARGHQVCVLTSRHGVGRNIDPRATATTDVVRSLYLESDLDYYRPLHFFTRFASEGRANLRELRRLIVQFRPDVLVVWGMWQLSLNLPYYAERWMPGRVAYYIASYWPTDADPHAAYWRLPARRALTEQIKRPLRRLALARLRRAHYPPSLRFDHVACVSGHVRRALVEAGKLPDTAEVLHCGIDPTPFSDDLAPSNRPDLPLRLLYFGRIIQDKGVHTAIEAMGVLRQQGLTDQVQLTIVGAGHPDYETHLRDLVSEHGLQPHVSFAGSVAKDQIPRVLQDFDVFLSTSIWAEPLARTILFAMLAGLVVVASDTGGTREVLSHYDEALLFPPGDARALADRVVLLLNDQPRRRRLATLGRRLVLDRFTLNATADAIEAYLLAIVQGRAAEARDGTHVPTSPTISGGVQNDA